MKLNKFGKTGLNISQIVIGGGWVGGILIDASFEIMRQLFEKSINSGINWIDTAESYSNGKSEKNIGNLLKEFPKEKIYISTKGKLDLNTSESIMSQIDRKVDLSLERLKLNHVELYQLHNKIVNVSNKEDISYKDVLKKKGVLDSFEKIKSEGRIKNIGITALGDVVSISKIIDSKGFDTAQIYYNLLNPTSTFDHNGNWNDQSFSGLISKCVNYDMGIMCIRIFAAGLLATDKRHGREIPVTQGIDTNEEKRRCAKIFKLLQSEEGTRAQIALRYGLSNKLLSCIVVGMAKLSHFDEILEAIKLGPLDEEILEKIKKLQVSNFE